MRVIEADAKQMLADGGLRVTAPRWLYGPDDQVLPITSRAVVKAQTLSGNRAESGLIEFVEPEKVLQSVERMRAAMAARGDVPHVLVESMVDIDKEYYLAWRIDDLRQKYVLMFSLEGGSAIESRRSSVREYTHSPLVDLYPLALGEFFTRAGVPSQAVGGVARYAATLFEVFRQRDATLVEINPLVVTKQGGILAVDAKLVLDASAAARHGERERMISHSLRATGLSPLEARAAVNGITFVELDGTVAVFSSGAGLGLCLTDALADAGLRAANFVDASGGSGADTYGRMGELVFQRARAPSVDAILFFFLLSATSLKGAVDSLLKLTDASPPPKPLVVCLIATGAAVRELTIDEARRQVEQRGFECVSGLPQALERLRDIGKRRHED